MEKNFYEYKIIEEICDGGSSVEKYLLYKDGKNYLLRLYDSRFMKSRISAINNLKILRKNNVNVPNVYQYGYLTDSNKGFAIFDWIDGIPLNNLLYDTNNELKYGKLVAEQLKKIHNSTKIDVESIYEKFLVTFEKKLLKVIELGLDLDELKIMRDFVYNESEILKNKNQLCIIHGDFHPGNIIVDELSKIWFIDLDVCKEAINIEEFSSNACNMCFPYFYSSVISNYFNKKIPNDFWKIYNLYGCIYVLDYFLYLNRMKNRDLADGINILHQFLMYSNNFQTDEPCWFDVKSKTKGKLMK